jgi:hypothetical protein
MSSSNTMSDIELIGYAEIHCTTPRALFSAEHANRLIALAGNPPDYPEVTTWVSGQEDMAHLCKLARERLRTQGSSLPVSADGSHLRLASQNGVLKVDGPRFEGSPDPD